MDPSTAVPSVPVTRPAPHPMTLSLALAPVLLIALVYDRFTMPVLQDAYVTLGICLAGWPGDLFGMTMWVNRSAPLIVALWLGLALVERRGLLRVPPGVAAALALGFALALTLVLVMLAEPFRFLS